MKTIYKDELTGCYCDTEQEAISEGVCQAADLLRLSIVDAYRYTKSGNDLVINETDIKSGISDLLKAFRGGFVTEYREVKKK